MNYLICSILDKCVYRLKLRALASLDCAAILRKNSELRSISKKLDKDPLEAYNCESDDWVLCITQLVGPKVFKVDSWSHISFSISKSTAQPSSASIDWCWGNYGELKSRPAVSNSSEFSELKAYLQLLIFLFGCSAVSSFWDHECGCGIWS